MVGYVGILQSLPQPAIAGLKDGPSPSQLGWVSFQSPSGTQVTQVSKVIAPDHLLCRPHEICARSADLSPKQGQLLRLRVDQVTPVLVREATPAPEKGSKGPPPRPARLLSMDISTANVPMDAIGVKYPPTLKRHPPVLLRALSVNIARRIRSAHLWSLPRTLSEGGYLLAEAGIFHSALSPTRFAAARNKEIREIFRLARPALLPERLCELAYRVIVSGFWLGPNKINRSRGDSEFCHHCHAIEELAHVLFSCPKYGKPYWPGGGRGPRSPSTALYE